MLYKSNTDYGTFETTFEFDGEPKDVLALFSLLHLAGYADFTLMDLHQDMYLELTVEVDDVPALWVYLAAVLQDVGITCEEDTWVGGEYVADWWTGPAAEDWDAQQLELLL